MALSHKIERIGVLGDEAAGDACASVHVAVRESSLEGAEDEDQVAVHEDTVVNGSAGKAYPSALGAHRCEESLTGRQPRIAQPSESSSLTARAYRMLSIQLPRTPLADNIANAPSRLTIV